MKLRAKHSLTIPVLALCLLFASSAGAEQGVKPVSIIALGQDGQIIVESEAGFVRDWLAFGMGDEITLTVDINPEVLKYYTIEQIADIHLYTVLTRHPLATKACPTPMYHVGEFFHAVLPDGGEVYLRLKEGTAVASVVCKQGDKAVEMKHVTALEAIRRQLTGDPNTDEDTGVPLSGKLARLDAVSLLAFTDKVGQREAFDSACELTEQILAEYQAKFGTFPFTLCQIWSRDEPVVAALPRNPFIFSQDMCDGLASLPRPDFYVRYVPQVLEGASRDETRVVGYWLAICGDGSPVEPMRPLPDDVGSIPRAIRWIEKHPE